MNAFRSLLSDRFARRVTRAVALLALVSVATAPLAAQPADGTERRRGSQDDSGGRRSASPQDMQARMLANLRERFGVEKDDEWAIISERLLKLSEVRRGNGGGAAAMIGGFRGGPPQGGGDQSGRGGGDAARGRGFGGPRTPESEALQAAVADRLPEAEVKARLTKLRETRKANEKKLEQAQEDLRAVLTLRQEAIAVLMGLLP
jgi:hypothetical protein